MATKKVETKGAVGDGAPHEGLTLGITKSKDPTLPGEILVRAVLVDADGIVAKVLGAQGVDEDRWQAEGAEAVETELKAWAAGVADAKGIKL